MRLVKNALMILMLVCAMQMSHAQQTRKSALLSFDSKINGIITKMTLEEKIAMLHGKYMFTSAGVERLGIADMVYADGPFGIREELQPKGWNPLGWEKDKATYFPTGSALAATWSPELAYLYGKGMAAEARLRGKDMILGPAINIQRIPTGGRTYEYMSEDPYLSGRLSVGYTKGVQDNGVAACVKHYALNNQENNRGDVDVIIGERAMHEIYLAPFRAAVEEADAFGIMSAYNKVGGHWCSENDLLLNKILRKEWGFAGMVISDWGGVHSTVAAAMNGLDVEMPGDTYMGKALLDSVKAGRVPMNIIDDKVRNILRVRLAIKPVPAEKANQIMTSQAAQQNIAYQVACKSIVLLKNDGILPLKFNRKPVIAVLGDNANRITAVGGVGSGVKTLYEITPLEGIKKRFGERADIQFAQAYMTKDHPSMRQYRDNEAERNAINEKLAAEAVAIAAKADIVLFIGGDNREIESESRDRNDIILQGGQDALIQKIAAVNSNIVSIMVCGAPVDLNVINVKSKAVIVSWFNGSEGGNALADVLSGAVSPSGRLPFTWINKLEDSPAYALGNYPQKGANKGDVFVNLVKEKSDDRDHSKDIAYYSEESLVGYRWFDTKKVPVMYPFGYGLTYSTFKYSDIKVDKTSYAQQDNITVTFTLSNTGSVDAEEVAQLYVHRTGSAVEWPYKELKSFQRVALAAGKSKKVSISLPVSILKYWDEKTHAWKADQCGLEILVGASAGDIQLTKTVSIL